MLVTASLLGIAAKVAAVALLIGMALTLVRVARGRSTWPSGTTALERAQEVALFVTIAGFAVGAFVDSDIVNAVWFAGFVLVVVLALLRRRRGEQMLPRSVL
jgi:multisubunit Na+/H+ antiporter MnhF subunit